MSRLIDIKSMDLDELNEFILSIGEKKYRSSQIYTWLHQKGAQSFEEMSNLSKELITKLTDTCNIVNVDQLDCLKSKEDGTKKFLFELDDDQVIESVLMSYKHGNSVCISSQVGCKMGCKFCASTIGGLVRNLKPSEMLEQIYAIEKNAGEKISNIVVMGTGEPFDNYDNLMKFIKIINSKEGRNIGQRSITVSTCGIVPRIYDFADENTGVNLAISLHGADDEVREKLMPIVHQFTYEELMASCQYYTKTTNRRITFEYSLVKGVNDTKDDAYLLTRRLKGMLCHVNLIPMNKVEGKPFEKSDDAAVKNFKRILESKKITTTVRRALGEEVDAACGQLRRSHVEKNNK
ncbi:MAG: 23S rRNA (adenine(2503)-C(2))-methyltransferase RlmN [Firmicutes bacterium HGW-Firmicutes-1]|jgi:23S rRNA (adenine2503-C2)-methyltransferase|nr:MAG: 23S rRNA (adenine(2503)-C(2))-methyltransferase RlmN [Firmicutes bacterium HGW-Firmicutes-1]